MLKNHPNDVSCTGTSLKQQRKKACVNWQVKMTKKIVWLGLISPWRRLECKLLLTVKKTVTKCYFWILILLRFLRCSKWTSSVRPLLSDWGWRLHEWMHMLTGHHCWDVAYWKKINYTVNISYEEQINTSGIKLVIFYVKCVARACSWLA